MVRIISVALALVLLCSGGVKAQEKVYTLEELRSVALQESKSLAIAEEKLKMAQETRKATFTFFLPDMSGTGTYLWNEKSISLLEHDALLPIGTMAADGSFSFRPEQVNNKWTVVDGSPVPLDKEGKPFNPKTDPDKIMWKDYAYMPKSAMEYDIHNLFAGGIGFTQPIFMGFKIREMYNISKSNEQMAMLDKEKLEKDLVIEVDEAYWRTVSLVNKRKLAEDFVNLLTKLEKNVDVMMAEGVATKGDLLRIKVKLNEANLAFSKADNGVNLSKMALAQLCGLGVSTEFNLADEDLQQRPMSNDQMRIDLPSVMSKRLELKKLDKMIDIASANVRMQRGRFLPTVGLSANYLVSNPNSYDGFKNKFGGMFSVGVAVKFPIFHFGERVHTLRVAKHAKAMAELGRREIEEKIELQVNQSQFKMQEANKRLVAAISNIEAAAENLRLAEVAYKEGVITVTDLLAAQTAWVSANSDRIDAGIDVRMCSLYLKRAKGE